MIINKLKLSRYDWAVFFGLFVEAFTMQVVPVILLAVSNDLGFPLSKGGFAEGGLIQFFSGITGVSAILFGSFIISKHGKRLIYSISLIILFIGIIALAFVHSYFMFVIMMMLANAGGCMLIVLAPALAHDLHKNDSGKYITIANSFWSAGMLLTVILAGYILKLGYSWRYVLLLGSLSVFIPLIIMLIPQKFGQKFPEDTKSISIKETAKMKINTLKNIKFWKFVILLALVTCSELIIGLWTASYIQLNFSGSAETGGFAIACFAIGMIISRFVSGHFVKQKSIKKFIMSFAFAAGLITATFPYIESISFFYIMLFLAGLAIAPLWPCIQSYSIDQLPEIDKTIILVLLTIAGIATYSIFSWITGIIATLYHGLEPVYYIVPLNYFICIIILLLNFRSEPYLNSNKIK